MKNPIVKPNIIVVLLDDMGYSDLGCYGGEILTPNIDYLADKGIKFSQFYSNPRCCPTRASLLTGIYPHQTGIGNMMEDFDIESYRGRLNNKCITIAEILKTNGYSTGMCGKWNVGGHCHMNGRVIYPKNDPDVIPTNRGFDRYYGTLLGAENYYYPCGLMENEKRVEPDPDEDYYLTDVISTKAVQMIQEFNQQETPFFLYMAYTAPHWPLHALQKDIDKFSDTYAEGWDNIRDKRYQKLLEMGLIDEKWFLSPRNEESPAWENVENKEWESMRMAVYAAQIHSVDRGVGLLLDNLKKLGIEENTVIMLLSDNGGCEEVLKLGGFVDRLTYSTERFKKIRVGNYPEIIPGGEDTYMSYGLSWANVSNTPFRKFKKWTHEGGIASPLIIYWPEKVKGRKKAADKITHVMDLMPTILDITKTNYLSQYKGVELQSLEGESFYNTLEGIDEKRVKPIVWEHEGNCAVRHGKWKLVKEYKAEWELYNMEQDRTESNDLSLQFPEIVKELSEIMKVHYTKWGVENWDILLGIREKVVQKQVEEKCKEAEDGLAIKCT